MFTYMYMIFFSEPSSYVYLRTFNDYNLKSYTHTQLWSLVLFMRKDRNKRFSYNGYDTIPLYRN